MTTTQFYVLVWLVILGMPTQSWAQQKKTDFPIPTAHAPQKIPKELTHAERVELEYLFTDGLKFFLIEDYAEASKIFQQCLEKQPNNPVFHYKNAQSAWLQNNIDEAIAYGLTAQELDPKNPYYYEFLIQIYQRRNQHLIIAQTLEELIQNTGGTERHYFDLAMAYLQQDRHKEALKTYDRAEQKFGASDLIMKHRQNIYLSVDDIHRALQEGNKLIQAFPDNADFYADQANLLLADKKPQEAEKLLQKASEIDPDNPRVRLVLSDLYRLQGKSEAQQETLNLTFRNPAFSTDEKIKILKDYLSKSADENHAKLGKELSEIAIRIHPENAHFQELHGKFTALLGHQSEAIESFKKALELNPNNYRVWEKLIQLQIHNQDTKAVLETTENALEYFPNQATFWFYNGNAHLLENQYENAVEALEQSQLLAINNPDLQFQILGYLGAAYHGLKAYPSSDMAYAQALELRPEDPMILNNYGYALAKRGEKLDLAEKMCQKLLEINANSPAYLDTYAWVLYAKKDYKKSLKYLEQALQITESGAILEHYGDVLYKTGNAQEALIHWKKAKTLGGKLTENIDKKIAEGRTLE